MGQEGYSKAMAWFKNLNLKDDYADFTTWLDADLLRVRMTIELSNVDEADRFMTELKRRGLVERYWDMRKPTY